ncbi:membrane lipoprotein lipid attachment site-containing protein [Campylobacter fetus]|uniref:membrane lipoprotein lipid attachment site-containing protein n=1 Tax=Campylobacter fetus TaxID=196 RepID=UPI000818BEAE|nr:membrane lipoprotein lipid attachment site-containing protein [Campylobacter fetus]OCS03102.1 hypothetical protein CFTCF782_06055 [Campylobacter fetus subsp. testudinum]
MKRIVSFIILVFLLQGCIWVNERGISNKYYNDCKEYYDGAGIYHKKCDENLLDWSNESSK